jgi:hypothetical protein
MKARVTLSLDPATVDYLNRQAAAKTKGNLSAYLDQLVRDAALAESVDQHAAWYATHPTFVEDAEAERYAA